MHSYPMRSLAGLMLGVMVLLLASAACAQDAANPAPAAPGLTAASEDMQWWQEARFGLFIHWGPVSLKGTEIGWSRGGERLGTGGKGEIPVEVYDNLYKEFNPTEFNAREWVALAQAAGMKYLVFTSKHHDGFVMFDSKLSDYTIMHSPFKRDIVGELAQACHEAGLRFGLYYSPPDWHHPDYRTANHASYIEYLHGQIRELCSNYGQLDILWFDGLGGTAKDWDATHLLPMARSLQPHIIINNRAGLPADHDTPEQCIGTFQNTRPWESCITICQQWAWKPNDKLKSLDECVQTLVRCAGGDGNLLFNVGPMPTGAIEPRQVDRLKEIGAWLKENGETIYGTRGGPFWPGPYGASTRKGNMVYIHLLEVPESAVVLPALPKAVKTARILNGSDVACQVENGEMRINVPLTLCHPIDTIVALELEGSAMDIPPIHLPSSSVAFDKPGKASNTYQNMAEFAPGKALDDDDSTRWATDGGTHEAWLEVDLGKPVRIGRAVIKEAFDRVTAFDLQAKDGDQWKTFATGGKIGEKFNLTFEPITAQVVRLNIRNASEGPTLWEFQLLAP